MKIHVITEFSTVLGCDALDVCAAPTTARTERANMPLYNTSKLGKKNAQNLKAFGLHDTCIKIFHFQTHTQTLPCGGLVPPALKKPLKKMFAYSIPFVGKKYTPNGGEGDGEGDGDDECCGSGHDMNVEHKAHLEC